jgi:hypothetical protein
MNEAKQCSKCITVKPLTSFAKNGSLHRSVCKECTNADAKLYRQNHLEEMRAKDAAYYANNKRVHNLKMKTYREEHREDIRVQKRLYYEKNKETIMRYHEQTKDKRNNRLCERRASNSMVRIMESLKARLHYVLKSNKQHTSSTYIGCTNEFLRIWIEYQFDESMGWSNYGSFWQIDHVIPVAAFALSNKRCQLVCFHWSNLRPLHKVVNMSKSDKIVMSDIETHDAVLKCFIQSHGYQTMPERTWWLREELRYGKNPEDAFQAWLEHEMGNPQPSS